MVNHKDEESRLVELGLRESDPGSRQRNFINFLESYEKDKLKLLEAAMRLEKHPPTDFGVRLL